MVCGHRGGVGNVLGPGVELLLTTRLLSPQDSMDSVHRRLERSRQMQTVLRAFEARDRNLLENNLWRVSFWSCASLLVMLCVALTQVHTHTGGRRPSTAHSACRELQNSEVLIFLWSPNSMTLFLDLCDLMPSQVYTVRKLFDDKRRVCT